jgi:hypothetical protein
MLSQSSSNLLDARAPTTRVEGAETIVLFAASVDGSGAIGANFDAASVLLDARRRDAMRPYQRL